MDKQKLKIILIAIAVLLAIFLLYRTLSKISDNKTAAAGKIDSANADLTIKQNQDAYVAEREEQKKSDEETKNSIINEAQIADGYTALSEYMDTLTDTQRELYKSMRTDYIRIMGVDPGVMSYTDLQKWSETYSVWSELNDRYVEITGTSKSYLDPDYDTVEEMRAAVLSAESQVKDAWEQAWIDEYELFCHDREGFVGCPYISLGDLRRYLDSPEQILPFQEYMTAKYRAFQSRYPKLSNTYKTVKEYFDNGYINWKNSAHNFVRGANDLPDGTYNELSSYGVNECCLLSKLMNDNGGVSIYSEVNSFNAPKEKKTWYNLLDASLAVANFQMAYETKTNILAAVATAGISAAIQKNNKVRKYMPERLNSLMSRIEASATQTYTPFGYTAETLADSCLGAYSQVLYGFPDYVWDKIESNQMDINDWIESDQYKKSIIK